MDSGKLEGTVPPPSPASPAELHGLLLRYGDLVAAQHDALLEGTIRKAAMLARSAEDVLADAYRADRRLHVARGPHANDDPAWAEIEAKLGTVNAYVQSQVSRLRHLLVEQRSRMLSEIGRLEPHGVGHGPDNDWSAPPTLLNIRT